MLPLRLVPIIRSPSLSMANGQWLAFTRAAYDAVGGHAAVRAEVVEDVALGPAGEGVRRAAGGVRGPVAAGGADVRRRARRCARGSARTCIRCSAVAAHPFAAALALLFDRVALSRSSACCADRSTALLPLAVLAAVRIAGALLFGQGWRTVVLHPAGALLAAVLAVESWIGHERGRVRWKGRELPPRVPVPAADA